MEEADLRKLKKERKAKRISITTAVSAVSKELEKEVPDQTVLQVKQNQILQLLAEVQELDKKILDDLMDKDGDETEKESPELDRELADATDYQEKGEVIIARIRDVLSQHNPGAMAQLHRESSVQFLQQKRGPILAQALRTEQLVQQELQKEVPDKLEMEDLLNEMQQLSMKLSEADEMVVEAMYRENRSAEDIDAEYQSARKNSRVLNKAKLALDKLLFPALNVSPPASHYSTANSSNEMNARTCKLPKLELQKYSGDLKEWLGWWAQFQKIHEDARLDDSDKFQYLIQATVQGSVARQAIDGYPKSAENYPKAVEALKENFGNQDLLQNVYVKELIKLVEEKGRFPLDQLYFKLDAQLKALESLGVTSQMTEVFVHPLVESSLSTEVLLAWQRSANYDRKEPEANPPKTKLYFLMEFIKKEVQMARRREVQLDAPENKTKSEKSKIHKPYDNKFKKLPKEEEYSPTASGLFAGYATTCAFCEKSHPSQECISASYKPLEERIALIKRKRCCFICLRPGHPAQECKTRLRCPVCGDRHHALMCPQVKPVPQPSAPQSTPLGRREGEVVFDNMNVAETNRINNMWRGGQSKREKKFVILETLVVYLGPNKKSQIPVRLLFDNGSTRTTVTYKEAVLSQSPKIDEETNQHTLYGGLVSDFKKHNIFELTLESLDRRIRVSIPAIDEEVICHDFSRIPEGPWQEKLRRMGVVLSDTDANSEADRKVVILVGSDYYHSMLTGDKIKLEEDLYAIETVFGWVLSGQVPYPSKKAHPGNHVPAQNMLSMHMINHAQDISDLWTLEAIGIKDTAVVKSKTEEEQEAVAKFKETVYRENDGRFTVKLPFICDEQELPSNRQVAENRLVGASKKLVKQGSYHDYDKIFKNWLEEGIIEEVQDGETSGHCHYLPHRPVFKPNSKTTPVRPVFDASCKVGRSPSLNDCLHTGPNLLELIPTIMLRFREFKYGVISDIKKAFQMISVQESDRDFLRFLWWEDDTMSKIKIYRHRRVVFGLRCSPFLLGATLEHHLSQAPEELKKTAEKILSSLYVDNCATSFNSMEELMTFKSEAIQLLAEAKMELREWEWSWGDQHHEDEDPITNVLGMKWDKRNDSLHFSIVTEDLPEVITKRSILSRQARIFDPMGYLSPSLLQPKLLLQEAWSVKASWDEELPDHLQCKFKEWHDQIAQFDMLTLPRSMSSYTEDRRISIHSFSDASGYAYSTAIFLRTETAEGVVVRLLLAKSRLAPIKKTTINRLELMGAWMSAKLTDHVKQALWMQDVPTSYYTDSTTVRAWIRGNDQWGRFVGNRVRDILQLSDASQWFHVPGIYNPADLPSRGCSPSELIKTKWEVGPAWLKLPASQWPTEVVEENEDQINAEKLKKTVVTLLSVEQEPFFKFAHYSKNVRVFALVLRFVKHCQKKPARKGTLLVTTEEMQDAEIKLWGFVQVDVFPPEAEEISNLRVQKNKEGLFCVKTKLFNEDLEPGFRFPVLLPNNHQIVEQLIREVHEQNFHAGVQFLMSKLRERVWIIQGRAAIRRVLKKCVTCLRHAGKVPFVPVATSLPEDRVSAEDVFEVTGVDCAGPLYTRDHGKVWFVLFTCATYRAIHLELIKSMDTEEFIMALSRFISRRGRPRTIYSDNGTNFEGAVNVFKTMDWDKVQQKCQAQKIVWKFNPPSAPWYGGFWERLIQEVKKLLRRILGRNRLTLTQLETCLCEAEAIVNARPLTFVTEDQDDLIPLTPEMFMRGLKFVAVPELDVAGGSKLQQTHKVLLSVREQFRSRFQKEYLALLVQKGRQKKSHEFHEGDVVLICADNRKRCDWPMGRILELIKGRDGFIRQARVRIQGGVLRRPLQRLFPLEVGSSEKDVPFPIPEAVKKLAVKEKANKKKLAQLEDVGQVEEMKKTRFGRESKKPSFFQCK